MKTLILLLLSLSFACESSTHVDIDAVIEENVAERLNEFQRVVNLRCRNRALEEAGLLADSIIIAGARQKLDTMQRPPRPLRPDQPILLELKDSFELAPLFDTTKLKKH
jgi:hypothetical protein